MRFWLPALAGLHCGRPHSDFDVAAWIFGEVRYRSDGWTATLRCTARRTRTEESHHQELRHEGESFDDSSCWRREGWGNRAW